MWPLPPHPKCVRLPAMATPLTDEEVKNSLEVLSGWTHDNDALTKTYRFAGFPDAIGFIARVAFDAEKLNHHPEWQNVYNRVAVRLTTHDAGNKVTDKDVLLAGAMEAAMRCFANAS